MTQQFDMLPPIAEDAAVLERIAERLPRAREVRCQRLPEMFAIGAPTSHVKPFAKSTEATP